MSSRVRTGCGKTLAFVLPIVQRLLDGNQAARPEKGRSPRVIVLAPTRELAKQVGVHEETIAPVLTVEGLRFVRVQACLGRCVCSRMQARQTGTRSLGSSQVLCERSEAVTPACVFLRMCLPRLCRQFFCNAYVKSCRCTRTLSTLGRRRRWQRRACMAAARTSRRRARCGAAWTWLSARPAASRITSSAAPCACTSYSASLLFMQGARHQGHCGERGQNTVSLSCTHTSQLFE